jgi:hypothetical protein
MKFFVSLLILHLGFVALPVQAQSTSDGITADVLGVYFTPPANAAAAIVKVIDASEREVLVQAYGFPITPLRKLWCGPTSAV